MTSLTEADRPDRNSHALGALRDAIAQAIVGQDDVVEQLLIGLLAGGHCLLEGVPGLGKTLLVRSLGQALDAATFRRIQFTPDLMPSDIIGTEILEEDHGTGQRVLQVPAAARCSPTCCSPTNSTARRRRPRRRCSKRCRNARSATPAPPIALPAPFFVLATQNPLEQAGTYPLPEAQLDRFLLHIRVDYPSEAEERDDPRADHRHARGARCRG